MELAQFLKWDRAFDFNFKDAAPEAGDAVPDAAPITLYALRAEHYRRRVSKGGPPGIDGADQRPKIPVGDQDWADLQKLATELGGPGHSPSAGQVASILLSLAIESVKNENNPHPESRPMGERLAEKLSCKTRCFLLDAWLAMQPVSTRRGLEVVASNWMHVAS